MAASRNDSAFLAANALFVNRVRQSMLATAIAAYNEAITTATLSLHLKRAQFATQLLGNSETNLWAQRFAYAVATDALVLADATATGTVALNATNADVQQALATDAHIDTAVSGMFNTFFAP